jgi:hypothetical protein
MLEVYPKFVVGPGNRRPVSLSWSRQMSKSTIRHSVLWSWSWSRSHSFLKPYVWSVFRSYLKS